MSTIAQMLVEVGADVSGAIAGMQSATAAIGEFQAASKVGGGTTAVFDERVGARIQEVAANFRALGQSESEAAASAEGLRGAIASAVTSEAQANIQRLAPTLDESGRKAGPLQGIFNRLGSELTSVGRMAAGMATGMLAANAVMSVSERFKEAAEQIDIYGQATLRVMRISGESAEASSTLVAMFARFAPSVDEAVMRLTRFEKALAGQEDALDVAASGGKTAADYLKLFGVSANDATGHLRPTTQILLDLADGFRQSGDAAAKQGALVALFGRGGESLQKMLEQGRTGLLDFMADAKKYGMVLSQDNVNDVAAFVKAHKDMDMAMQGVSLQLGAALMPAITGASQAVASFAQMINQTVMPAIKAIPGALPAISFGLGILVVGAAVQATAAMIRFAVAGVASVLAAIPRMAIAAASAAASFYAMASAAIASAAASVSAWVAAAAPVLLVIGAVVAALGLFYLAWQNNFLGIRDIVGGVTQFITDKIAGLMDWLAEHHLLGVSANWREGWQKIKDDAGNGIQGVGSSIKSGVDGLGGSIKSGLDGLLPKFGETGKDAGDAYGDGLAKGIEETAGVKAAKAAKEAADSALKAIQDAAAGRKLTFELAHVEDERNVLTTKLDHTEAEQKLVDFKRQLEDLDRNSVDYARKRLQLDEQDAVTRAKAQVGDLEYAAGQRKNAFDLAHVAAESNVLSLKLAQASAEGELIDYKRQLEDLDRASVDYAQKRVDLDQQDAITKAKMAESALKANDEDLSYQQRLLKAQLVASRHGGPAVDRTAIHQQLRALHNEELQLAPSLLVAEHDTTLANRAKEGTDLTASLGKNDVERQKLGIQEAMAPLEAQALARQRGIEDAQRLLDLDKQRFELSEQVSKALLLQAQSASAAAEHAKALTDTQVALATSALERLKLNVQEAMAPFEAAATFAKRAADDAQTVLDLAKQNFAIWETYYEKDRIRAEIAAKDADHALVVAQQEAKAPITVNVTVNNTGAAGADPNQIKAAVTDAVTQAINASKSGAIVMTPQLGGSRYATA